MLKKCDFDCGYETEDEGHLRAHHSTHLVQLNGDAHTKGLIEAQKASEMHFTKMLASEFAKSSAQTGKPVKEIVELYREALAVLMGAGL